MDEQATCMTLDLAAAWIKKWLWCSWVHNKHRCYPDVSGLGLRGAWHCTECHPCGEVFDLLVEELSKRGY